MFKHCERLQGSYMNKATLTIEFFRQYSQAMVWPTDEAF